MAPRADGRAISAARTLGPTLGTPPWAPDADLIYADPWREDLCLEVGELLEQALGAVGVCPMRAAQG